MEEGKFDCSSFNFRHFRVVKPIDITSKQWTWECELSDGKRRTYNASYLNYIRKMELAGNFVKNPKQS